MVWDGWTWIYKSVFKCTDWLSDSDSVWVIHVFWCCLRFSSIKYLWNMNYEVKEKLTVALNLNFLRLRFRRSENLEAVFSYLQIIASNISMSTWPTMMLLKANASLEIWGVSSSGGSRRTVNGIASSCLTVSFFPVELLLEEETDRSRQEKNKKTHRWPKEL